MWRLEVSSEAELEIFEAAFRYERERIGLGVRFETQVNTVFARLVDNPLQFPVIDEGVRRAIVRVFPYAVYFILDADVISVLAVLHMHRIRTRGSDGVGTASEKRRLAQGLIRNAIRNAKPPGMPNCLERETQTELRVDSRWTSALNKRPKRARKRV